MHIAPLLAMVLAVSIGACEEAIAPPPAIRPVRTITVSKTETGGLLQQTGEIRPRFETAVGFRTDGKVVARPVDVGSLVKKGDELARLDTEAAKSQLRAAGAAVSAAEAEVVRAKAEEQRQRTVLAKGFTTQTSYDIALRNLQTARAQLESAEAQRALADQNLGFTDLRADSDGVVTAVGANPGQVVAAGQMIVRLARLDEREAVFDVAESVFKSVPRDADVKVELVSDPARKTMGSIRYVSPQADPLTRTFSVRVSLPDAPPEMRLGASVRGSVDLPSEAAIAVPGPALFESEGRPALWVFDPATETVNLRPISILRYDADRVLVADGVASGDVVVTAGVHTLRPNQKVRLAEAAPR